MSGKKSKRSAEKALIDLLETVKNANDEVKEFEKKHAHLLANRPPAPEIPRTPFTVTEEQVNNQAKLGDEVARTVADIEFLKAQVPEGMTQDDNLNFYLALADMKETNDNLREQLNFCAKNLNSLKEDAEKTKEMERYWSEIVAQLSRDRAERDQAKGQAVNKDEDVRGESALLDNKIRKTAMVYKQLKNFMAQFLDRVFPGTEEDDNPVAKLLQCLWNSFLDDRRAFLDIKDLEFDVDVPLLVQWADQGIIEFRKEDQEQIKLVDFTE